MRITRDLALSAFIAVLTGAIAIPAVASADPDPLAGVVVSAQMTAPSGIVETPDGAIWVADEVRGVCRLALAPPPAQLVASAWCGAGGADQELPDAPEPGAGLAVTPIAAVVAAAGAVGPASVSGLVFDPVTENFYASDRASSGGGVWRLHWNSETHQIDGGTQIVSTSDRVATLALAPGAGGTVANDVLYVTKRAGELRRILDPIADPADPADPALTETVAAIGGTAGESEVTAMALRGDDLYLAGGGLQRLSLNDPTAPQPVAGFEGRVVSALAIDATRGRLYAGTTDAAFGDIVEVLDLANGDHEPYEQGLETVTALAVEPDGAVLVADGSFTVWAARLWRVPLMPMGRPQASITAAPVAVSAVTKPIFDYSSSDLAASFECRMDNAVFEPCPGTGVGTQTYPGLPEGSHRFSVRAMNDAAVTGLYTSVRFTLDRTAPRVTVSQPPNDYIEGGVAPRIPFSGSENGLSYACSLDNGPFATCWSGDPVENLTAGVHVLRVVATDAAGNVSDPSAATASARITVLARRRAPSAERPAASVAGTPAQAQTPAARTPLLLPFTLRVIQSPSTTRRLRFGLDAPDESAQLRVTVKDSRAHTVVTRVITVRPNAHNRVDLRLTPAEQRRLRPGRYLVTAVLRTAGGTEGNPQTHWLRVRPASRP